MWRFDVGQVRFVYLLVAIGRWKTSQLSLPSTFSLVRSIFHHLESGGLILSAIPRLPLHIAFSDAHLPLQRSRPRQPLPKLPAYSSADSLSNGLQVLTGLEFNFDRVIHPHLFAPPLRREVNPNPRNHLEYTKMAEADHRKNPRPRPLSDSEKARLDEFIDSIHYSAR